MSNLIWKTPDQKPESLEIIAFYVDGYLFTSYYEPQYNQYGIFGASKVEKWCYMKELSSHILALETELEQLKKENEAMREEFEVRHGNHKCVLEDNERLQEAVDLAVEALNEITSTVTQTEYGVRGYTACKLIANSTLGIIKQLIKGE